MQAGEYRTLLRHMEWADASIWSAALKLESARHDERLLDRLYHLHSVQWAYLKVWQSRPLEYRELGTFDGLETMAAWARSYYSELSSFATTIPDAALVRTVEFPWADQVVKKFGSAAPATLGESVLHVVLHTTYHRGQVATRVRELGGEPPLTDLIAWLWAARPEPRWAEV
ncbi:MAG: DinB family protein [Gemmatimonadales bacterium]